ncbi:hypothetical protein AADZ90_013730 [Aestuariibius sp. 2305UL40-4]|uniref:hypothetical protein n=1 Tax=Aestuariibius violaceus TaxID=3234132 RepID=UPI00345EB526
MPADLLETLRAKVQTASVLDHALLVEVTTALQSVYPQAPIPPEDSTDTTEDAIHMVDACLPGWTISLRGKAREPDGHWRCSLREGSTRDNDAAIGIGTGPTVALALTDAILCLALFQRKRTEA